MGLRDKEPEDRIPSEVGGGVLNSPGDDLLGVMAILAEILREQDRGRDEAGEVPVAAAVELVVVDESEEFLECFGAPLLQGDMESGRNGVSAEDNPAGFPEAAGKVVD